MRRIGRGGMGFVWCAEDTVLERKVAVKLLSDLYLHDPAAVRRFAREARAAARLSSHPNVVTIFDVGQTASGDAEPADRPYIVMEHLPGGTVGDAIRVGEVDRDRAVVWISQAAAAIDYAHGSGVIHRDIKPSNMLLDGRHILHVADFGIARVATEEPITSGSQMFGTAAYLSPEQALGRPATEASDHYALAVVAYELLAGVRPFTGSQPAAQARQHVEEQPAPATTRNRSLPHSVDAVLARGLAKPPGDRWGTATEFAQALEGALSRTATLRHPRIVPARREARPARSEAQPARREAQSDLPAAARSGGGRCRSCAGLGARRPSGARKTGSAGGTIGWVTPARRATRPTPAAKRRAGVACRCACRRRPRCRALLRRQFDAVDDLGFRHPLASPGYHHPGRRFARCQGHNAPGDE